MVTEDYVSFEIAKLLKEKGFDGSCFYVWTKTENAVPSLLATANFVEGEMVTNRETLDAVAQYHMNIYGLNNRVEGYLCPSIAMAMKWLRNIYNLHIIIKSVIRTYGATEYYYEVNGTKDHSICVICDIFKDETWDTYEQACESAIKYCLEKLI